MMTIENVVQQAQQRNASDVHMKCGLPIKIRRNGQLENMTEDVFSTEVCESMAKELAGFRYEEYETTGELDLAGTFAGVRCRIHIYRQQGEPSIALRLLQDHIPALEKLGLPPAVENFVKLRKGIVLVTGETGSGKSTTLAALLDRINHSRKEHIVTLEDPIEYIYTPDLCAISQREVGRDTVSFASGLRASLREDPDVILIGEMRDRETIETAITAAETGHLVFATLHTGSASDAVDRMVQVFPEGMQSQIRLQLSMTLEAVLTQQLIPDRRGGRTPACELMIVTDAIRNLIRVGNTPQIVNCISTGAAIGGQTMDQALVKLVREGTLAKDTALSYAHDPSFVKKNA